MSGAAFCPVGKAEKLLLVTDRTEFSEGAVLEAVSLARLCSSTLYVMTVVPEIPEIGTIVIGKSVAEKQEEEVQQYFARIKKLAREKGIPCETIVHEGVEPHDAVIDEATAKKVDMIIIGKHGYSGVAQIVLGETAAQVVGNAPCKVLVVPKAARIEYKKILVATDGSGHSKTAVEEATSLAKRCGGSIIALSSIRSDTELENAKANVNAAVTMAEKEGVKAEGINPTGRSYNLIVEIAAGRGVDLIVMGLPVKSAIKKIFTGSATEQVIGKAGCGVLIVKSETITPATV